MLNINYDRRQCRKLHLLKAATFKSKITESNMIDRFVKGFGLAFEIEKNKTYIWVWVYEYRFNDIQTKYRQIQNEYMKIVKIL